MKSPAKPVSVNIAPELRCVWMTAGILSYHLCDRQFDCDNCPLDRAMRQHFTKPHEQGEEAAPSPAPAARSHPSPASRLSDRYLYSNAHLWVFPLKDRMVQIGLEGWFIRLLPAPKEIVMPPAGRRIRRGESCCWISAEGETLTIPSPVEGTVEGVNAALVHSPALLVSAEKEQVPLLYMRVAADEFQKWTLMTREEAEEAYDRDMQTFRDRLRAELKPPQGLGPTLADGGESLRDVPDMIGTRRYCEILNTTFLHRE